MNQLMLEIQDHHIANKIVKFIKKHFINFKKIMKRLQLIVFIYKKKMNWDIRTIIVYILNDFKRVHNKTYSDLFMSIWDNFHVVHLMISNMQLIKNFQINVSFDNDFVKNSSVTASRIDIIKIDILTFSIKAIAFKFSTLKIVFVILRKTSQSEKIN